MSFRTVVLQRARGTRTVLICCLPVLFAAVFFTYSACFDEFPDPAIRDKGLQLAYVEGARMLWLVASSLLTVLCILQIGLAGSYLISVWQRRAEIEFWVSAFITFVFAGSIAIWGPQFERAESAVLFGVQATGAYDKEGFSFATTINTAVGAIAVGLVVVSLIRMYTSLSIVGPAESISFKQQGNVSAYKVDVLSFRAMFYLGSLMLAVAAFEIAVLARWSLELEAMQPKTWTWIKEDSALERLIQAVTPGYQGGISDSRIPSVAATYASASAFGFTALLGLTFSPCLLKLYKTQRRLAESELLATDCALEPAALEQWRLENGLTDSPLGPIQVLSGLFLPILGAFAASLAYGLM